MKTKSRCIALLLLLSLSYQCKTVAPRNREGGINEAIENAIDDFVGNHKSLSSKDNTFYVNYVVFPDYFKVTILGFKKRFLYNPGHGSLQKGTPTEFIENRGKLFLWYGNRIADGTTIQTYLKYDLLVDDQNGAITMLFDDSIDDSKKAVGYYICKSDLTHFRKVVSNYLPPAHPRLKCRR